MSVLAYPPRNEEDIFRHCTKECGIITATEDQQYFALGCLFCPDKFLYFDAFIGHMQTMHATYDNEKGTYCGGAIFRNDGNRDGLDESSGGDEGEDLTDADPALLEPQMVMIKQETPEEQVHIDNEPLSNIHNERDILDVHDGFFSVKQERPEAEISLEIRDQSYMGDSYGSYGDEYAPEDTAEDEEEPSNNGDDDTNYDDLVEESLLGGTSSGLTMHIKDRKMIQFLINAYRRNSFLWDHRHPQFRDRVKRQQFLEWINMEFKRRFNLSLAKDAVTRKWDNLRTVYKRECNRMALEKTNVSTLWYFKELHFLNRLYGGNQKISDAVVKETVYRRRYSALWNDVSTGKLLSMVQTFPCFYDKYNIDYRSKEKRGEALQKMAVELQKMIDVTTIQISKRISQLRFDYSKQKQERLMCEQSGRVFVPSYSYYDQMFFMDADVAPFKCEHCPQIINTPREMDVHLLTHQPTNSGPGGPSTYYCPVCQIGFNDCEQFNRHKHIHLPNPTLKEVKYHCDLCTASFREKSNYDEHMRRHNDELLLPSLANDVSLLNVIPDGGSDIAANDKPFVCDICGKAFSTNAYLMSHRELHTSTTERSFKCDYPHCGRTFTARHTMMEHVRQHYSDEEFKCDICGKGFKSTKNLQNHKQIHDAVKRYVCKICGSAFAQAAGLYLHKRRHNRQNERARLGY